MEKILKAEGLTRAFENKGERFLAVRDVSFSLYRGEAIGIVGESGSGKSTLVRMLTGLLAPTKGKIEFLSRDLTHAGSKEWRKCYREMQLVFQLPKESFDSGKTLGSGIGESLRNSGLKRKEVREKVGGASLYLWPDTEFCRALSRGGERRRMSAGGHREGTGSGTVASDL